MSQEFKDKVIIVTGASLGIGRQIVESLILKEAKIVACSRNESMLNTMKESLSASEKNLLVLPCDVSCSEDVDALVGKTIQHFGGLHGLVNNAGIYPTTPLFELSEKEWDRVIDTNLKGPFLFSKAVAKEMVGHGVKGSIVNISSTASLQVRPGVAHYASSKAGLNALTKVLAVELAPYGIRVNTVIPGLIMTEGVKEHIANTSEAEHKTKLSRIPMKTEGEPQDIADAVTHFLSEASQYTTGSQLVVDGGYTLGIAAYTEQ
jgi:NAD(P)-dependent dehydrogenase (short-subunit alcohol dehydrogenase family)